MISRDPGRHLLEVTNFGPITKADVELRPLTVFFGPSNTGKSYLAKLTYALHRYFSEHLAFRRNRWRLTDFYERARQTANLPELAYRLEEYLHRPVSDDEQVSGDTRVQLEADLAPLARAAVKMLDVAPVLADEMLRIYGAHSLSELIRKPGSDAGFTLSHVASDDHGDEPSFRYLFTMANNRLDFEVDVREDASIRFERSGSYWLRARAPEFFYPPNRADGAERFSLMRLQAVLADLAQPCTVGAVSRSAYFLPASRSGLVESHGALVGSSLERLTRRSHGQRQPTLSGVLADFITQTFVDLGSTRPGWNGGNSLAKRIEQTIIRGTVRVDEQQNGTFHIAYRPTAAREDLPLIRASSMVTEVVPLVLYLRHYATLGSTVIIEEPEAHMHPAMQVRMAAAIAEIVDAGVRVIVTTHSEWILSALANLVRSAELPMSERQDVAGHGIALRASEVGCWQFVPETGDGSETREIRLDSDAGMYDAGYPEVGQLLYNEWATIISRLQET